MRTDLPADLSVYQNRKLSAVTFVCVVCLLFCVGCGSKQVMLIPDYDNEHYRSEELRRPELEVVKTVDTRDSSPEQLGTARVGMFNVEVPYLLSEPASEFVGKSLNTILGTDPQAEKVCPVTVRIDELNVHEIGGFFGESAFADCQLSFSFPVSADSTSVTRVSAVSKDGSLMDATAKLEGVLYESIAACAKEFLDTSYDNAPSRFLVARAEATQTVDKDLQKERFLGSRKSRASDDADSYKVPSSGSWWAIDAYYHHFMKDEMQDAYGGGFGFEFMGGEDISNNMCFGVRSSILMASGTPAERQGSIWHVESSKIFIIYMPISVSLIYPTLADRKGSFKPYAGIGGGGVFSYERMEGKMSTYYSTVEAAHGVFRAAWTGEIFFGAEFGGWAANPFIEFRGIVAGRSSVSWGLSEEEDQQLAETLYDALIRPEEDVAGGQVCLGIRW